MPHAKRKAKSVEIRKKNVEKFVAVNEHRRQVFRYF